MNNHKQTLIKKSLAGLVVSILLIVLDQLTKFLAVAHLKNQAAISILPGVFELSYLENRGAAFSILQNQRTFFLILTPILLILIVFFYLRQIPDEPRYRWLNYIAILIFSGAIGNFIDRAANGYVVDFFYFVLIDFPVFNVADIYVVIAAALLIILGLFYYKEEDFERLLTIRKKTSA